MGEMLQQGASAHAVDGQFPVGKGGKREQVRAHLRWATKTLWRTAMAGRRMQGIPSILSSGLGKGGEREAKKHAVLVCLLLVAV